MIHHRRSIRRIWNTAGMAPAEQDTTLTALEMGRPSDLADIADRILLSYALKLPQSPGPIRQTDVVTRRGAGFDDLAICDLCAIVAYFAFVNRIADGLGVQCESHESTIGSVC